MFEPNPFSPGKRLTQPELFAGRREQLRAATQVLIQAAHKNSRHALVTGERGVGKSSFSSQLQGIARAEERYLDLIDAKKVDVPYVFLVVEHIAQDGQGPTELALGLLQELEASKGLARFAKFKFDFTIDLGVLRTAVKLKEKDPQDAVSKFIEGIQQVVDHVTPAVDGILLVIDEIDRIADTLGVSTFFKVVTERLSSRGMENVTFLLVGLVGTLENLRVEHPSVGRVFKPIDVPLMDESEGLAIVTKALATTSVTIEEDVARMLVSFSGGYANSVHLLGEQAFDLAVADDHRITREVVEEAVKLVVQGAAREDYDPRYFAIKGRARNIVNFVANEEGRDVPSADIARHLKLKASDLSQYFDSLMRTDVLVRPADGVYRLREPLFREYLRHVASKGEEPVQRRPQRRGGRTGP